MTSVNDELSLHHSEEGLSAFYMYREVYTETAEGLIVKSIFPAISDDLGELDEKGIYVTELALFAPAWPLPGPVVPPEYWETATFDRLECSWIGECNGIGEATVTYTGNSYSVRAGSQVYSRYGWVPARCQVTERSLTVVCFRSLTEWAVAWPMVMPVPFTEGDTVEWFSTNRQWTINGRHYDENGQEFEEYEDDDDYYAAESIDLDVSGCVVHGYSTDVPDYLDYDIPNELCLGLEAEFKKGDEVALNSAKGLALFKADSSCGVELVSVPLPPAEMLEYISNLEIDHLSVDRSCGVHVHLSRKYLTQSQIGGLVVFMNHPSNLDYITKVAGRSPNGYCRFKAGKSDTVSEDRYEMVNLTNNATVEIRIFAGTNDKDTLRGYVEWLLQLVEWLGTNPTSYTVSDFLAFIN